MSKLHTSKDWNADISEENSNARIQHVIYTM